jgi:hypothetical protein
MKHDIGTMELYNRKQSRVATKSSAEIKNHKMPFILVYTIRTGNQVSL